MNSYEANRSSIESNRNKATGKFQNWQAQEAVGVEPLQMPDPLPGRQEAYELFADNAADAAVVSDVFDCIQTPEGEYLAYSYFETVAKRGLPSSADLGISRDDFERFDELAELGWKSPHAVLWQGGLIFGGEKAVKTIADQALTPERLDRLEEAGIKDASDEERSALFNASDDELEKAAEAYKKILDERQQIRDQRAREAAEQKARELERQRTLPGQSQAVELYADFNDMSEAMKVAGCFDYIRTADGAHLAYKHFAGMAESGKPLSSYDHLISRSDFHRFDDLARLGWKEPSDVLRQGTELFGEGLAVKVIAGVGLTPQRVEKLQQAGYSREASEAEQDALLDATDEELDAIIKANTAA